MLSAHASLLAAALGDELTESEASVRVFVTAGGLAILGCALLLFTIWWWRGTKPEPPALAPLEIMSDRRWNNASDGERRRLVEMHRPEGSLLVDSAAAPVPIDLSVLARDQPSNFDDLRDDPARWPYGAAESGPSADGSVLGLGVEPDAESDVEAAADAGADAGVPEVAEPAEQLEMVDATMYQVEAPIVIEPPSTNGHHDDDFELDQLELDEPSTEMVIDPLLQRTASQD